MRYFEVPRRRDRSDQSSQGKRLIYLSLVGGRRATLCISFLKLCYLTCPGLCNGIGQNCLYPGA